MKKFTKDHEWISIEGNIATVGITSYAAKELGDITFVEIPEVDDDATSGDVLTVVESVKAATDVFSPVAGKIIEVNEELEDSPQLVNESAEEDGWICKIETEEEPDLEELMSEAEYSEYIKSL